MKKSFRIISILAGMMFVFGFAACSNQFDELKKSLETPAVPEAQDNAEKKDNTEKKDTTEKKDAPEKKETPEQKDTPEQNEPVEDTGTKTDDPVEIDEDVSYYVEHWLQSSDGRTFGLDSKATQTLTGKIDSTTAAAAKEYQGFTAEEISQKKIKADGSTVVKVYYDRKTITYTFKTNGGKWSDNSVQKTVSGLYEAIVPAITEPTKTGARFCNWDTIVSQTFGLENKTYEAVWLTNSLTSYRIEHCIQNIYDDDYSIDTVQIKTSMPGEMTQAEAKSYTGFETKSVMQNTVNADGSTVARVYYDRKNITYTYNIDSNYGKFADNTTTKAVTKRYGAKVEIPEIIMNTYGITVTKWSANVPQTYDTADRSFTAQYGTNYYDKITYLPAGTNGSAGTTGTYVYFGTFPQRKVTLTDVTFTTSITVGQLYYYFGSDNNYYLKDSSGNYYLYEPIKWRVVTTNYKGTGKALLLAESILIASPVNGSNWSQSQLRTYLNQRFYSNAFGGNAKSLIAKVDTTVGPESEDYVFLLNRSEVNSPEYGLTDVKTRIRTPTDYAKVTNANSSYNYGCTYNYKTYNYWWLRDKISSSDYVDDKGTILYTTGTTPYFGVVPAIVVTLPAR